MTTQSITPTTNYELNPAFPIFPGMNRLERAQEILKHPKTIKKVAKGKYTVKSQFSFGMYVVDMGGEQPTCTCPDFQKNGHTCKHIEAVKLKLGKYSELWTDYNIAQTTEESNFSTYLKQILSTVEEPIYTNGRPTIPLKEQIFCAVTKVYSNKSSRRSQGTVSGVMEAEDMEKRHFNTSSKLLNREDVTPILHELVRVSALPLASVETQFAIDSSGFRTTQFGAWCDSKHGEEYTSKSGDTIKAQRKHKWLKCHIASGTLTNVITDAVITDSEGKDTSDTRNFLNLLDKTNGYFNVKEISADKGYLSKKNYAGAEKLGIKPYILFKEDSKLTKGCSAWNDAFRYLFSKTEEWLQHYHRRSNVESTFGALKAKFGEILRSKNRVAQENELLCKIIAYNITVVHEAVTSDLIEVKA